MRRLLIALALALGPILPAQAQISIDFGSHGGVSIGINVPVYPRLVRVPGYPVYYDPRANSNYFFYDGLYWVYQSDEWYASSWYNGPWQRVERYDVPLFLLRVPVRYYRHPPSYFHGWRADAPPRWGEHWGGDWESRRGGWDQWDRRSVPAPAPLPSYQQQYSGDRYPRAPEQQVTIRDRNYRYQPREAVTQQHFQPQAAPAAPRAQPAAVQQRSQQAPQERAQRQEAQAPQPRQAPPVQRAQPPQSVQQAQPRQPAQQVQAPQPPAQAQPVPAARQGKGQENKPESKGKGQENKPESKGKGQENKPESKGKGQEKKEEREQGRP